MCVETSSIFACGHTTTRIEECTIASIPVAPRSRLYYWKNPITRGRQDSCTTVMTYPPRKRADVCLECWVKQLGLIEVSDKPKGRDDLPRAQLAHKSLYYPAHHPRRLFRQVISSGNSVEDSSILTWTPRRFCADQDKIARQKEEAMAQIARPKEAPKTPGPSVTAQKAKARFAADVKSSKAPARARPAKGAKAKK